MQIDQEDYDFSADQLDGKYNPEGGGEHPAFPRGAWQDAVFHSNTLLGYWQWVVHQLEEHGHEVE